MSTEAELVRTPTHRVKNLHSLSGVRAEMANVYRLARKGEMETGDMARYIYALRMIAQVIQQTDTDERLAALTDQELISLIDAKVRALEGRPETRNGTHPHDDQ